MREGEGGRRTKKEALDVERAMNQPSVCDCMWREDKGEGGRSTREGEGGALKVTP
jgi:hypothetical protein